MIAMYKIIESIYIERERGREYNINIWLYLHIYVPLVAFPSIS